MSIAPDTLDVIDRAMFGDGSPRWRAMTEAERAAAMEAAYRPTPEAYADPDYLAPGPPRRGVLELSPDAPWLRRAPRPSRRPTGAHPRSPSTSRTATSHDGDGDDSGSDDPPPSEDEPPLARRDVASAAGGAS